jgi:hypothetical protein
MNITMIDDSYAFDGATSGMRALGGGEKAFAQLSCALASRGHSVTAINRCEYQSSVEGVLWVPFDTPRPPDNDVIIAFRKPKLLTEFEDNIFNSIVWLWGNPKILNQPANQKILERYNPHIVFLSKIQRLSWKSWRDFNEVTILPGVAANYIDSSPTENIPRPVAIVTTHPLHGLKNILRLWKKRIHPVVKLAELHVYSASLYSGDVEPKLQMIYNEVITARNKNVFLKKPSSDRDMAKAYCEARLHLYPVIQSEYYGSTLAESQACGVPAIVYKGDAAPSFAQERISEGQTGYIAPDDDAFVNLAVQFLSNDPVMYRSLSRDSKILKASRSWQNVAIEFENLWK